MFRWMLPTLGLAGACLLPTAQLLAQPARSANTDKGPETADGTPSDPQSSNAKADSSDRGRSERAERETEPSSTAKAATSEPEAAEPARVLFIGNSYSNHHNLTRMVERLAQADEGGPQVTTELVFMPGATLWRHWRYARAAERIKQGNYTHVVLQGHSLGTIKHPNQMTTYAKRFAEIADKQGSETILYATWARRRRNKVYLGGEAGRTPKQMQTKIDRVYYQIADEVDAKVAPVGRAWRHALTKGDRPHLYGRDGSHPAPGGSYLAACVLYATLTGRDPRGLSYHARLTPETAKDLQVFAAETVGGAAPDSGGK